jgi:hypothetical protein
MSSRWTRHSLQQRLEAAAKRDPETELQLRADTAVPYGRMVQLIGMAQAVGLSASDSWPTRPPAPPPPRGQAAEAQALKSRASQPAALSRPPVFSGPQFHARQYAHQDVERAAHAHWTATDAYRVTEDAGKKKFYACSMLPYPSGKLHMGHVRNYTINDMLTRYLRMNGSQRADAHGLGRLRPAGRERGAQERRAAGEVDLREHRLHEGQMQAMGLAIDWSREVATCSPDYYKWNQWLFLKMLEKGIAYRKTQVVNWDPVDQTVLANEQVIDGKGWRTGALVEKREIPGYYLNITAYADELLDHVQIGNDKATLNGWPDKVRLMQENWIGKSEGVRFAFTHDIRARTAR